GANLGIEAIREFEVIINSFDATFGRNSGAVINMVTKSGTNEIHGSVFEFHRNSALDARNFFDKEKGALKRNQFGFSLGGPVIKNKIFLFGSYEGLVERLGAPSNTIVPTADGRLGIGVGSGGSDIAVLPSVVPYLNLYPLPNGRLFPLGLCPPTCDGTGEFVSNPSQPTDQTYFTIRYDQQFSEADSLFVRYTYDNAEFINPGSIGLWDSGERTRRQYVTIEEKHIFSPSALNTLRIGYNRSYGEDTDVLDHPELRLIPGEDRWDLNFATQVAGESASIESLGAGGFGVQAWNSYQYADDFSYSQGRNSIRVGVSFDRLLHNFTNAATAGGVYEFDSFPEFLEGISPEFRSYDLDFNIWRGMRSTLIGIYIQDDYRWRSNLTFNLGFRFERMTTPNEVNDIQSQLINILDSGTVAGPYFNNPGSVWAPRIGLAWDISGNGKTSLRAGYGLFNDMLTGTIWVNAAVNALSPDERTFNVIAQVDDPPPALFPNAFDLVAGGEFDNDFIRIEPEVSLPTRQQWNLTLQHELMAETVLTVAYTGAVGRHGFRTGEANAAFPTSIINGKKFWAAGLDNRNPDFARVLTGTTDANSSYHSLQLSVNRRFTAGLQFQGAYTWGHSIDDGSQQWGSEGSNNKQNTQDFYDRKLDRGASIYDIRHNFSFNGSYDLPFGSTLSGWQGTLAKGWSVNSIFTLSTGAPASISTSFNRSRNIDKRNPDRPNVASGFSNNPIEGTSAGCLNPDNTVAVAPGTPLGTPNLYYDLCAFELPPAGFFGDVARSTVTGPGLAMWSLGLFKNFTIGERVGAQFRTEFFNLANRANFAPPQIDLFEKTGEYRGSAGRISRTVTTSRQIQFALKFTF
ncbi:MAG: TonB-dependent receptor, partial [Acidobacteria bacterium]|nr:TonB-dependent receptor [Acidobacteriota bacterium]